MNVVEASFSGTFRTIVVLSIVWFLLRLFIRGGRRSANAMNGRADRQARPPGDTRVENGPSHDGPSGIQPNEVIIDAEYEEVK